MIGGYSRDKTPLYVGAQKGLRAKLYLKSVLKSLYLKETQEFSGVWS